MWKLRNESERMVGLSHYISENDDFVNYLNIINGVENSVEIRGQYMSWNIYDRLSTYKCRRENTIGMISDVDEENILHLRTKIRYAKTIREIALGDTDASCIPDDTIYKYMMYKKRKEK